MAGLLDVAKDAGCRSVRCEHCGGYTDMGGVLRAMFRAILWRVLNGEKITISGFGIFEARLLKGWKVKPPRGKMNGFFKDRLVLRFRSSNVASRFLNRKKEKEHE